uniref:beta strand repeat-containing protein n=1 Tax=Verrucomicrobium sp. BvORR034 TaxID=1396418 RepID=UPI002240EB12
MLSSFLKFVCQRRRALAACLVTTLAAFSCAVPNAAAQQSWDAGGSATNLNWSNLLNWSTDTTPEAKAITFNSAGVLAAGTTSSIVDQSYSITSLAFNYSSNTGLGHTLQINTGQILTQTGGTTIGGAAATDGVTNLKVTGDGSWVINAASSDFNVGNTVASRPLNLDMSGLATFSANVTNFYIGSGSVQTLATVNLAKSSTVTATLIRMGASSDTGTTSGSVVRLGQSTTFNADTIVIATGRTSMTLGFQNTATNPAFTIRGKAGGTTRANLTLGGTGSTNPLMAGGSSSPNGIMDLRGGTLDFMLGTFVIGNAGAANATSGGIGYGLGTFSFNSGTIDVTNLVVARTQNITTVTVPGSQADNVHATFNMEGGTMTVGTLSIAENQDASSGVNGNSRGVFNLTAGTLNVTGELVMGSHTSTSAGYSSATLKLTGGTLTVSGNLSEGLTGDNRSTLELTGGTLDMTDGYINVDTLTLQSGTLKNVAQIYNGAMTVTGLVKTGTGTLILEGTNTYTGVTSVNEGTLQVGSGGSTGTLGSGTASILMGATLAFNRSDIFTVTSNLEGFQGNLRMDGTGTMVISQANINLNTTSVSVNTGRLSVTHAQGLGSTANLTVATAGKFRFATPGTAGATLSLNSLTLQAGGILEIGVGDTIAGGALTTAGVTTINVLMKAGLPPSGPLPESTYLYTLLTSTNGGVGTLSPNIRFYGLTNALVTNTVQSANSLGVELWNVESQVPTELYWVGGFAGMESVWAVSNGLLTGGQSNWAADRSGSIMVGIVPGENTNVIFSANDVTPSYMQNMVLGY